MLNFNVDHEERMRAARDILNDDLLPEIEKKEKIEKILGKEKDLIARIDRLRSEEKVFLELSEWFNRRDFPIQKNNCSRLHKLYDCAMANNIYWFRAVEDKTINLNDPKIFVVENDWASAFGDSLESGDEFILPFNECVFEFRLGGKSVIVTTNQSEGSMPIYKIYIENCGKWIAYIDDNKGFEYGIDSQIKAICIALDADVATKEIIRAPVALNKKIGKTKRCKLYDYHIVRLSKRYRATGCDENLNEPKTKKRLHFRRGHWRHFESHKTWIKWMLVGDPDLGFINKHYSL